MGGEGAAGWGGACRGDVLVTREFLRGARAGVVAGGGYRLFVFSRICPTGRGFRREAPPSRCRSPQSAGDLQR